MCGGKMEYKKKTVHCQCAVGKWNIKTVQFFTANVVMKIREEQMSVFSAFCCHSKIYRVL